jgi:N4-(beta-N-acetylglucosaminyl)-L-asparaginase
MPRPIDRRGFIAAAGLGVVASGARAAMPISQPTEGDEHRGPCAISSGNGARAVAKAIELIDNGEDPVVGVVRGVNIVESDPEDTSVGYGGLPNEDGVVQLDSSVMHGPTHKAGAVACLEGIKNPASVALIVLQQTDHCLLVGEGAQRFAVKHGFVVEELLTERARQWWLDRKRNADPEDDWLDDDQLDWPKDKLGLAGLDLPAPTYGTIHCSGVNEAGDIGAVTTTSGLSMKIPGRVGDSPIIGAGMFVDNAVGAAGATGRGEAAIQNCCSFDVVQHMGRGMTPTEACLAVLRKVAQNTRERRLLDAEGKPNFDLTLYALRKDGAYGSANMLGNARFTVHTLEGPKRPRSVGLYT